MTSSDQPFIVGVGEVLWDLLPSGAQMGGAPANFAYHAQALGAASAILTRVGNDDLGREILRRFEAMALPTALVQRDETAATGTVTVKLGADGVPEFTIHENVAWDRLALTEAALAAVGSANAVCFGSLGQRCEPARSTIQALVAASPRNALRIFDVNLRQRFYTREVIERSLRAANVLKLNDAELPVLADLFVLSGDCQTQIEGLARRLDLRTVALTRGGKGSLLYHDGRWSDHPGLPVQVQDTVGAGDAFTAALTLGLLGKRPLDHINALANEVARHVCSCAGATPPMPAHLKAAFLPQAKGAS